MRNQCLVGGHRRCPGNSRLAASSQSLPDADQCFSSWQRICSECTDLDVDCASGRLNRGTWFCCHIGWLTIQYLRNNWPSVGWFVSYFDRSEFRISGQWRLLRLSESVDSAVETTRGDIEGFVGKLLPIFPSNYSLRSLCTRTSNYAGPEFSIRAIHFSSPSTGSGA